MQKNRNSACRGGLHFDGERLFFDDDRMTYLTIVRRYSWHKQLVDTTSYDVSVEKGIMLNSSQHILS